GHVMAALTRHQGSLGAATTAELAELMELVQSAVAALGPTYRPDGSNVALNEGPPPGAGAPGPPHRPVAPRWTGASNFRSVTGNTRVLPESLDTTYDRLLAALGS